MTVFTTSSLIYLAFGKLKQLGISKFLNILNFFKMKFKKIIFSTTSCQPYCLHLCSYIRARHCVGLWGNEYQGMEQIFQEFSLVEGGNITWGKQRALKECFKELLKE